MQQEEGQGQEGPLPASCLQELCLRYQGRLVSRKQHVCVGRESNSSGSYCGRLPTASLRCKLQASQSRTVKALSLSRTVKALSRPVLHTQVRAFSASGAGLSP